jgi:hypothetical protein
MVSCEAEGNALDRNGFEKNLENAPSTPGESAAMHTMGAASQD